MRRKAGVPENSLIDSGCDAMSAATPVGTTGASALHRFGRRFGARVGTVALIGGLVFGATVATSTTPVAIAAGSGITRSAALQSGLKGAVRLNPPPPQADPPPATPPGSTVGSGLPAELDELLDLLNAERMSRGLNPLIHHGQLAQAAAAHAADYAHMNCLTSLSHYGRDGSDPGDRIKRTGLSVRTWGENLACNNRSAAAVNLAWMNSSGHRANILNPAFTHVGLSLTQDVFGHNYWVQVFGTPR